MKNMRECCVKLFQMLFRKWVLVLLLTIPFFTCCAVYEAVYKNEHSGEIYAMNTLVSLTIWGKDGHQAILDCESYIYQVEEKFSTTREGSEVSAVNQNPETWVSVSPEFMEMLDFALDMGEKTAGAFDPTIYPLVSAWGFTTQEERVPSAQEIQELLPLVGYDQVSLDEENTMVQVSQGMALDFGGITKGYVGDQLANQLKEEGITSAMISLGGNIYALGRKTDGSLWNIGIQNPYGGGSTVSVKVENKAVVTSGGYQRYFTEAGETYWHIIDPRTGYPAKSGLASVSIIADSAQYADCLSTALFVLGLEEAVAFWQETRDFEAIFITEEEEIYLTSGMSYSLASGYHAKVIS